MKNTYTLLCLIFCLLVGVIQTSVGQANAGTEEKKDSTYVLDMLKSPASPGAALVGISPNDIQKPTDPKALGLQFQNASNSFTTIPKNFALDIAPKWFFRGKNITLRDYNSRKFTADNIYQSLVISAAYKQDTSIKINKSQFGIGFKISLLRGKLDSATTAQIEESTRILREIEEFRIEIIKTDSVIISINESIASVEKQMDDLLEVVPLDTKKIEELRKKDVEYTKKRDERIRTLSEQKMAEAYAMAKKLTTKINYARVGGFIDVAGGVAWDYPNNQVGSGKVAKAGIWIVGGGEWKDLSVIGMARYLQNPDKAFADVNNVLQSKDVNTFDIGGRLIYKGIDNHILVSSEALYRSIVSKQDDPALKINPSWRFTLNAEYTINKSMVLTFVFGRDFDNTVTKSGTLVSFLNLLTTFGKPATVLK